MITDDILKDISGALSKKIKKDFTKYKEYSILFLACDAHVRFARVAQWWSTSLPRRGSRVRSPSRAFIFLEVSSGYLFCYFVPRRVSNPCGFDVSPAGSVVASASQRCPTDTNNPSRFLSNDK